MPNIAIGRQPIFDKELETVAYELLFRDCDGQNQANITDGDQATSNVILAAFTEIGLDNLVGNKLAFLNLTRSFLEGDFPLPDMQDRVVLEILEDIPATESTIAAVHKLGQQGYTLALDDFIYHPGLDPFVDAVSIIKLDILAEDRESLTENVKLLRKKGKKLLAEKVESHEEFEFCKSLGFDYYQGYFFCRPEVVTRESMPTNKLAAFKILTKLQDPDIAIGDLENDINHDVGLSYRLLKYINSAQFALRQEIESISQAIMLLGLKNISSIATLIVLSRAEDNTIDLFKTGLIRAKMCQLLAEKVSPETADTFFTAGLMSIVDALMGLPMQEVMQQLPLSQELQAALVNHQGEIGETLQHVTDYVRGNISATTFSKHSVPEMTETFLQAVKWADDTAKEIIVI